MMDRDPRGNDLDPVERETPSTGANNTSEIEDEAVRVIEERRQKGIEPDNARQSFQNKQTPGP